MNEGKSQLIINRYVLGTVDTNCYVVHHEDTREAVIVDPADEAGRIIAHCDGLELKPVAILLTHGHFDHIMAADELIRRYGVEIYAGKREEEVLASPHRNLSGTFGKRTAIHVHHLLEDGEEVQLAGITFRAIHTPGHTPGSVGYWIEDERVLFSGDTLFFESLGRTDFPGGSQNDIFHSIKEKLFKLPKDTEVYSGHGEPTTIGHEMAYNPVVLYR